ncbi:MAG: decarboxylase, group [Gammaproteobacteria bacterium]|nr:decarboxylase, group [Gammaproteobacteria bacterium]
MNPLDISEAEFRRLAARVSSLAADYYGQLPDVRAYPYVSGAQMWEAFDEAPPDKGLHATALDALEPVMEMSRAPSARFFGYVLGSGEPVAALADLLASVLNQNVTAWRSAPAAVTIERQVLQWIAQALGREEMSGSLCGGGSAANLMALAMAREARLPANECGAQPAIVYASSEAHMSIPKAVALLGLGRRNLRLIAVDEHFRMSVPALEAAIAEDRAAGRALIAVVASAGTVSTGAIDPLERIGAICRAQGLWLHVDGAYGLPAALVAPEKFRGLSAADSLSLDLHKWLYQPVDCGMLLFKDPSHARAAFSHTGDYARVLDADPIEGFAFFEESLELSRRFRALKIWLSLRYHGLDAFRAAIRADLKHAQLLVDSIRSTPQLELLAPVELSAVCFRYCQSSADADLDKLNAAILSRVIENGRIYLSNAAVHGHFALRACFVNHRTQPADVAQIVPEVLKAAREIGAGGR